MALPEPDFIARDPAQVTADLVSLWETTTGKTLYPGQIERVFIDVLAYRETLLRVAIQETAKANLLAYARAPMLDYLGELMGVVRLAATAAQVTVEFTLAATHVNDEIIPAGTRISAGAGQPHSQFTTDELATIAAGELTVEVNATAVLIGAASNDFVAGQLATLDDALAITGLTVANTTTSSGAADEEADEPYRQRIRLAPESYTTAGSVLAYRYHALSAHPSIIDVAIVSPMPGAVDIYPLCRDGLPSAEIRALVAAACNGDTVRPLCDYVTVAAPTQISYTVAAQLVIYADADATAVTLAATAALATYTAAQSARLGRDITRSALIAVLSVPGVYRVTIQQPAGAYTAVGPAEWAVCTSTDVTITGIAEDVL